MQRNTRYADENKNYLQVINARYTVELQINETLVNFKKTKSVFELSYYFEPRPYRRPNSSHSTKGPLKNQEALTWCMDNNTARYLVLNNSRKIDAYCQSIRSL